MQSLFLSSALFSPLHSNGEPLSRGHANFKIKLDGCSSRERISRSQVVLKNKMSAFSISYALNGLEQRLTRNRPIKIANSVSNANSESKLEALDLISANNSLKDSFTTFVEFVRPFVFISTAIRIIAVSFLSVERLADINPMFFTGLLQAIVPALLMNVFVGGINQLCDIEIDKINKPYLPLASGKLSSATAIMIVALVLITSTLIGIMVGSKPLLWFIFCAFVYGIGYSIDLPWLRWKNSAVAAAISISAFNSFVFPIANFLHIQTHVLGQSAHIPLSLIFTVAFSLIYTIALALFKDIPDVDGDKKHGVKSLTARLGQKQVFWICISMLLAAYGGSILVGLFSSNLLNKAITISGNATLALALWARAKSTDLESNDALESLHLFIVQLFTAEFLLIPFIR